MEAPRAIERVESIETLLPPRPERPYKTVGNSGIPNICVGLLSELAAVAGDESQVIAEVVVHTDIKPLCIFRWQAIAAAVQWVKLLHTRYELNTAEKGGGYGYLRELVGRLDPIPPPLETAIKFRLQIKRELFRLPGDVGTGTIYFMLLKQVLKRFAQSPAERL